MIFLLLTAFSGICMKGVLKVQETTFVYLEKSQSHSSIGLNNIILFYLFRTASHSLFSVLISYVTTSLRWADINDLQTLSRSGLYSKYF